MRNGNFRNIILVLLAILLILLIGLSVCIVNAGQNECLPVFSGNPPISTDIVSGGVEVVQGGSFFAEAPYKYNRRTCKDPIPAMLTWQLFVNGVPTSAATLSNKHAEKVEITTNDGFPSGTWLTVRAIIAFTNDSNLNGHRIENEIKVFVVSKPAAPKIVLSSSLSEVDSKVRFNVPFDILEAHGSSNNFVHDCSLVLRDEQGLVVDIDSVHTDFGKPMPVAKLKANKPGIHTITVSCSDSYGIIGTTTGFVSVDMGDKNKKSSPVINIDNPINCVVGDCFVKYYINAYNKSLNVTCYDIIRGITVRGGDQFCKFNFTKQGNYPIKLVVRFLLGNDGNKFIYSDPAETTITVVVSQLQSQQQTLPQIQPTPRQTPPPPTPIAVVSAKEESQDSDPCGKEGVVCKTPSVGGLAAILIVAIAFLARRMQKSNI